MPGNIEAQDRAAPRASMALVATVRTSFSSGDLISPSTPRKPATAATRGDRAALPIFDPPESWRESLMSAGRGGMPEQESEERNAEAREGRVRHLRAAAAAALPAASAVDPGAQALTYTGAQLYRRESAQAETERRKERARTERADTCTGHRGRHSHAPPGPAAACRARVTGATRPAYIERPGAPRPGVVRGLAAVDGASPPGLLVFCGGSALSAL